MTRQEAESATILRCEVGSTAHGISVGSDDRDEMGVLIEPIDALLGLGTPFEQFIFRTATERTGKQDEPSQPGDLDLTLYSLRKYLRLAMKGNPTVLSLLFSKPLKGSDARGTTLQEMAPFIVSKLAGNAFLGYMQAQRQKLTHERGGLRVKRPELEAKFGYDTKFACHMLRLGLQGVELLETGRFSVPMSLENQAFLQGVRRGEADLNECLQKAGDLEKEVRDLTSGGSPIPDQPNHAVVEAWMIRTYWQTWSASRTVAAYRADYEALRERNS